MAISDENKLYCVNNLIVMILNDLYELNPGIEPEVIKQKCNYSGPPVPEALPTGPRLTGESQ